MSENISEVIAVFLSKNTVGARFDEIRRNSASNLTTTREILKNMVSAGYIKKVGIGAATRYELTNNGRMRFIIGNESALTQTVKTAAETPETAPPLEKSALKQIANDEIEAKPYPFVTDSILEDFETRITHHIPINEKTVDDIKRHINGSTPDYYKGKSMQVFDVLDEFLTPEAVAGFHVGNIIKYVVRYKGKGGREDLLKARDYLDRLIEAH